MAQSKKSRAFALFSQGFTPTSPEIKQIGLHPANRYKYFSEWNRLGQPTGPEPRQTPSDTVAPKPKSGESIGMIDETRTQPKPAEALSQEDDIPKDVEDDREELEEDIKPAEAPPEKPQAGEDIGVVSEAITPKGKDGKPQGTEVKIATTIADEGIKCTVFLSLQTLALYKIAASTQAQADGEEELSLGDFLDTCAEDFFKVRGKKLGLISSGGK